MSDLSPRLLCRPCLTAALHCLVASLPLAVMAAPAPTPVPAKSDFFPTLLPGMAQLARDPAPFSPTTIEHALQIKLGLEVCSAYKTPDTPPRQNCEVHLQHKVDGISLSWRYSIVASGLPHDNGLLVIDLTARKLCMNQTALEQAVGQKAEAPPLPSAHEPAADGKTTPQYRSYAFTFWQQKQKLSYLSINQTDGCITGISLRKPFADLAK